MHALDGLFLDSLRLRLCSLAFNEKPAPGSSQLPVDGSVSGWIPPKVQQVESGSCNQVETSVMHSGPRHSRESLQTEPLRMQPVPPDFKPAKSTSTECTGKSGRADCCYRAVADDASNIPVLQFATVS